MSKPKAATKKRARSDLESPLSPTTHSLNITVDSMLNFDDERATPKKPTVTARVSSPPADTKDTKPPALVEMIPAELPKPDIEIIDEKTLQLAQVSIRLSLYQSGFTVFTPHSDPNDEYRFHPYSRFTQSFLSSIDAGQIPESMAAFADLSRCSFYQGCLVLELLDFRAVPAFVSSLVAPFIGTRAHPAANVSLSRGSLMHCSPADPNTAPININGEDVKAVPLAPCVSVNAAVAAARVATACTLNTVPSISRILLRPVHLHSMSTLIVAEAGSTSGAAAKHKLSLPDAQLLFEQGVTLAKHPSLCLDASSAVFEASRLANAQRQAAYAPRMSALIMLSMQRGAALPHLPTHSDCNTKQVLRRLRDQVAELKSEDSLNAIDPEMDENPIETLPAVFQTPMVSVADIKSSSASAEPATKRCIPLYSQSSAVTVDLPPSAPVVDDPMYDSDSEELGLVVPKWTLEAADGLDDNALTGDNDELKNEDAADRSDANSIDKIMEEYRPKSLAQLSTNHAHLLRCAAFVHNTEQSRTSSMHNSIRLNSFAVSTVHSSLPAQTSARHSSADSLFPLSDGRTLQPALMLSSVDESFDADDVAAVAAQSAPNPLVQRALPKYPQPIALQNNKLRFALSSQISVGPIQQAPQKPSAVPIVIPAPASKPVVSKPVAASRTDSPTVRSAVTYGPLTSAARLLQYQTPVAQASSSRDSLPLACIMHSQAHQLATWGSVAQQIQELGKNQQTAQQQQINSGLIRTAINGSLLAANPAAQFSMCAERKCIRLQTYLRAKNASETRSLPSAPPGTRSCVQLLVYCCRAAEPAVRPFHAPNAERAPPESQAKPAAEAPQEEVPMPFTQAQCSQIFTMYYQKLQQSYAASVQNQNTASPQVVSSNLQTMAFAMLKNTVEQRNAQVVEYQERLKQKQQQQPQQPPQPQPQPQPPQPATLPPQVESDKNLSSDSSSAAPAPMVVPKAGRQDAQVGSSLMGSMWFECVMRTALLSPLNDTFTVAGTVTEQTSVLSSAAAVKLHLSQLLRSHHSENMRLVMDRLHPMYADSDADTVRSAQKNSAAAASDAWADVILPPGSFRAHTTEGDILQDFSIDGRPQDANGILADIKALKVVLNIPRSEPFNRGSDSPTRRILTRHIKPTFGLLSADPSGNAMALYSHLVSGLLGDTHSIKNSEQGVEFVRPKKAAKTETESRALPTQSD